MISREQYLELASKRYHDQFVNRESVSLLAVRSGRKYLSEHGIKGADQFRVAQKYQLGVVLHPLKGDERYAGMLSIPYLSPSGVKAIKFRRLDGGKPKMMAPKNQPVRLFNTLAYFTASSVIGISEGEVDAIVATEMLGVPTLGVPGADTWNANALVWTPLFKNVREVLIFKDGDPEQTRFRNGFEEKFRPGDELADAISASLKLKARVIDCPVPEDVSSMVAAGRAKELTDQFTEQEETEETELTGDPYEDDPPPF